ncbi:MAG: HAD family hydrolase [Erysipelotrichia bacterium]|nr:HAD family hydrolase [Erysipelotrichia bacterium]
MFENIKVIVADIDGTLARQSHQPSEYTLRMIDEVREKGYLFGLASGRTLDDVIEYYKLWNLKEQFDFIIAWNGCELWDNLTQIKYEYNKIAKQDLKEICQLMSKFDCTVSMYLPQVYLTTEKNARTLLSAGKSQRKLIVAESMEDFYRQDNFGIMFRFDRSLMNDVEKYLSQYSDRNYNSFKTQPDLMEFSHKEANKAYALKQFCLMHDIPLQQCLAFGDTTNDNELLKCCYGVCLLNGTEDTKKCAQAITDLDNEHDGCAHYIKKYLLNSNQ